MLIAATPYDADKNLGRAYNEFMRKLDIDDWAVLIDHDAMWTTNVWHRTITQAIEENPEHGLFVTRVSDVGCWWMRTTGVSRKQQDMLWHRKKGWELHHQFGAKVTDVTEFEKIPGGRSQPLSGTVMVISWRCWDAMGGFKHGFLGVDNAAHHRAREAGYRVGRLDGVYVYHYYRRLGRDT